MILSKKNFKSKKYRTKNLGPHKKFWVQKILGTKDFGSKKKSCPTEFRSNEFLV